MKFLDLLYFSKGERRALIVLLSLIVIALILLMIFDEAETSVESSRTEIVKADTVRGMLKPAEKDTSLSMQKGEAEKNANRIFTVKEFKRPVERKAKPKNSFPKKFSKGVVVELNHADSTILQKVPGIGPVFSARIIKYRNLLGGFYSTSQLSEVYGIDEDRYISLKEWFVVDSSLVESLYVNSLSADSLVKHPYVNYRQARIIERLRKQYGALPGWESLSLLEEFTEEDIARLRPYISFNE